MFRKMLNVFDVHQSRVNCAVDGGSRGAQAPRPRRWRLFRRAGEEDLDLCWKIETLNKVGGLPRSTVF
jgi:hypothetical protein